MEQPAETHRIQWRGIEIQARYWPGKFGAAHLEIESIVPGRAILPVTETGYRSHFHARGTVEAYEGGMIAYVVNWLNEAATSREWLAHVARSRQLTLF